VTSKDVIQEECNLFLLIKKKIKIHIKIKLLKKYKKILFSKIIKKTKIKNIKKKIKSIFYHALIVDSEFD